MISKRPPSSAIRVLLSEGSSTNVREMITALGPCGYTLDLCDPNPLCMGRFSRYIRTVHRCPVSGTDPIGYLRFIIHLLQQHRYDVLFPANEQAYLFAWAKDDLAPLVGLAVADFSAFRRVQTKSALIRFLDELGLAHPPARIASTWEEIERAFQELTKPLYLKTSYGTASTGVWRVDGEDGLLRVKEILDRQHLLDGAIEVLVQSAASGTFEQAHAIFDHGHLLALHCTRRLLEGAGGGATVKAGVHRPIVQEQLAKMGQALSWHGSFSMDYFFEERSGVPSYIDANPRITEPMNAAVNGINLADLQVRLSLGEKLDPVPLAQTDFKSHSAIQAMLGAAASTHSRRGVLRELERVILGRGAFAHSREGMTPVLQDFPSIVAAGKVLFDLLVAPGSGRRLASKTIANYSLGAAIPLLASIRPEMLAR